MKIRKDFSGFGFPMVPHPHKSQTFYVVPQEGNFVRVAANRELAVYGTTNGDRSWKKRSHGLPNKDAYLGCYREGLAADQLDPAGLYVGTYGAVIF